jgi:hypothetical protein
VEVGKKWDSEKMLNSIFYSSAQNYCNPMGSVPNDAPRQPLQFPKPFQSHSSARKKNIRKKRDFSKVKFFNFIIFPCSPRLPRIFPGWPIDTRYG